MAHNIVLKDTKGNDVTYEAVSKINLLDTDGNEVVFSEQKTAQAKTITPTTSDQTATPDDGCELTEVIVKAIQTEERMATQNGEYVPTNGKYITKFIVDVASIGDAPAAEKDTSASTVTSDSVLTGYDFYDKSGEKQTGSIESISGGTFTANQVINTANKFITSDIIINVPNGNTRLENDSLYKMKALDLIRCELGDTKYTLLPTDEEYLEQQTQINASLDDTHSNITNFVEYAAVECPKFLIQMLLAKNQYAGEQYKLDVLSDLILNIGLKDGRPVEKIDGVGDTTATRDKVLSGRAFYNSLGYLDNGNIDCMVGRSVDINQVIPTANKFLTSNIEVYVPSDANPNETLKEMLTIDLMRYTLDDIPYCTMDEYEEQQSYVNNLIYKIQGEQF